MLLELVTTARDLGRLQQIAGVLIRHGSGDLVRRLGIAGTLQRAGRWLHSRSPATPTDKSSAQHLREALEELGPTFVKIGQMLAGRTDLLPQAWADELGRLQERVAPAPAADVRAQLIADLGQPPETAFATFDPTPVAAASIAQVYRATLPSGDAVAVKVRRPGIRATVDADLRLLARLAQICESEIPELRRYRPQLLVRQLTRSLRRELDLRSEAANAERMAEIMRDHADVTVPRIHSEWTSERLCVSDFLDGPSLDVWLRTEPPAPARQHLARVGANAVLGMVFEAGFFHADPHPGNLIVLPDGRLGLLDFGMVGHFSKARRRQLVELLGGVVRDRAEDVVDVLLRWTRAGDSDLDLLTQDCAAFIERYKGRAMEQLNVTELLHDIAVLLRDNDLVLPGDLALLFKVLVTLDSVGRRLDPGFVMSSHLQAHAAAYARRRFRGEQLREAWRAGQRLLTDLPAAARRLSMQAGRRGIPIDVHLGQLEGLGAHLERSANRLAVGLVTAALIVATALMVTISDGPRWLGLPPLALLSFASSLACGLWLVWSIRRSRRS
ncbi:MAG: AarF/UbiB family protein [Planctomycetota bacterium]